MLKETSYKEKIEIVAPWLDEIIMAIKKDLKHEHLKIDRPFCNKYFLGKSPSQLSATEMARAYQNDIREGNIGLAEFIATRWLSKHTDIYHFFETELQTFTSDFEALEILPADFSHQLIERAIKKFGAQATYIFSIFNSVVFPQESYESLRARI